MQQGLASRILDESVLYQFYSIIAVGACQMVFLLFSCICKNSQSDFGVKIVDLSKNSVFVKKNIEKSICLCYNKA